MNEDYLWNKTGEPDPEIERLEKTLGRMRYKRPTEPLPLPAPARPSARLRVSPALAIAATLLILLLAGLVWFGLLRRSSTADAGGKNLAEAVEKEKKVSDSEIVSGPRPPVGPETPSNRTAQPEDKLVANASTSTNAQRNRVSRREAPTRQAIASVQKVNVANSLRREELAREGEQAKEQLIMALYIASDKLNTVQKKIQASPGT